MSAEDIEYDDFKLFPTRESAMDWLRFYLSADETDNLLKALSVAPCEDAISRQAELDAFGLSEKTRKYGGDHSGYDTMMLYEIQDVIEDLPSVTPKQKMGRWLSFGSQGEIDGQIVRAFTCSECGAISIFRLSGGNIVNGDLCPNCGAKMEEVDE